MDGFERGFKSWAERAAEGIRQDLGLRPAQPLEVRKAAAFLGVQLLRPEDVDGMDGRTLEQLLNEDPEGWSAVGCPETSPPVVIYNPKHSDGRTSSSISHELAHILLGHKGSQLILAVDGTFCLRSYDRQEEAEADWLGATLLLPRPALLHILRSGKSREAAAAEYRVSKKMLDYRLDVTGVRRQVSRARRLH